MRTNLCIAPSLELDGDSNGLCDNWTQNTTSNITGSPTFTRVADPYTGTYAQRIQYTGVAGDSAGTLRLMLYTLTPVGSFAQNDYCTASCYWKGTISGCAASFIIRACDAAGSSLTTSSSDETLTSDWTRVDFTSSVFSNASTSRARLEIGLTGIGTGDTMDLYFDSVLIENGQSLGGYFDGSSSAGGYTYAWTGTANASTSTETESPGFVGLTVTKLLNL